jgi:hypothetical protein
VAEAVVDELEAVEVEEHDDQGLALPAGMCEGHREPVAEEQAVGKPGEGIVIRVVTRPAAGRSCAR